MSGKKSHSSHKSSKAPPKKDRRLPQSEGDRFNFWAHDKLEDTDDPFEDDFAEDITKPLK